MIQIILDCLFRNCSNTSVLFLPVAYAIHYNNETCQYQGDSKVIFSGSNKLTEGNMNNGPLNISTPH